MSVETKISDLRKDYEDTTTTLNNTIKKLTARVTNTESSNSNQNGNINELYSRTTNSANQIVNINDINASQNATIEQLIAEQKESQQKITDLQNQIIDVKNDNANQNAVTQQTIVEQNHTIQQLTVEKEEFQQKISDLQNQIIDVKNDNANQNALTQQTIAKQDRTIHQLAVEKEESERIVGDLGMQLHVTQKLLCKEDPDPDRCIHRLSHTKDELLLTAIEKNDLEEVTFALEEGGNFALGLKYAAQMGKLELIKYFIKTAEQQSKTSSLRANKNIKNISATLSLEALEEASAHGHLETVKYLVVKRDSSDIADYYLALEKAISSNHIDIVKYFISKGININNVAIDKNSLKFDMSDLLQQYKIYENNEKENNTILMNKYGIYKGRPTQDVFFLYPDYTWAINDKKIAVQNFSENGTTDYLDLTAIEAIKDFNDIESHEVGFNGINSLEIEAVGISLVILIGCTEISAENFIFHSHDEL